MAWFICFVLWILGAYTAGTTFDSFFDNWGPTRMSLAIVFWPLIIAVALCVLACRAVRQGAKRLKDGW